MPGAWPAANSSGLRASSTTAPSAAATVASGAGAPTKAPRLSSTIRSMFGGRGAVDAPASATNSFSSCTNAALNCRSNPIVVEAFELIWVPQSEPATWPGKTSTPSPSSSSARSERCRSRAPSVASTARSGRAAVPTSSESPVMTNWGSSPRALSTTAKQQCSGRCPGVCRTRMVSSPTAIASPSASGSNGYSGSPFAWIATRAPCSKAKRPWPERWSAWVCVSSTRTMRALCCAASSRYGSIA